ncbi:MAG TPA: hypothetical protein VM597_21090 [Gemmataceae bacterium]|jgi:hypothetical protein|nr:hypothetical protein [Gemmataceae bacterium]
MTRFLAGLVALTVATTAFADPATDAVKKVEAVFEPADARPGQTVTLKITVALADGYHTYPVVQPADEAKFSANKITFPADGPVVYVGDLVDPVGPKSKTVDDPVAKEKYELLYYPGGGTWVRKAVVLPTARAGAVASKVKVKLLVCDADNCFPPKTVEVEAKLKVLDGPAVEVEKKYQAEVGKAGKK